MRERKRGGGEGRGRGGRGERERGVRWGHLYCILKANPSLPLPFIYALFFPNKQECLMNVHLPLGRSPIRKLEEI